MLPGVGNLSTALGAAAGGVVAGLVVFAWMHAVTIPAAKNEARAVEAAEAERRTLDAINVVSDAAERARAMRRYCGARGLQYSFEANQCR